MFQLSAYSPLINPIKYANHIQTCPEHANSFPPIYSNWVHLGFRVWDDDKWWIDLSFLRVYKLLQKKCTFQKLTFLLETSVFFSEGSVYTLFSKRNASLICPFPLVPLVIDPDIGSIMIPGPVAYKLPQKKCNFQKLAFLLEKSVQKLWPWLYGDYKFLIDEEK